MLIKIPRRRMRINIHNIMNSFKLLLLGKFKKGKEIRMFEKKFAEYIGCKYSASTYSGKQALYIILKSMGLKKNDEILLAAYNASSVPITIALAGLKPVFVDVDPKTFNINPKLIKNRINKKTKAILVTHIHGLPCDIEPIVKICKKHKLFLIEDCAHALGAEYKGKKVGTFGTASFFSFGSGKHLSTLGGGMIVTNNSKIAKKMKNLIRKQRFPNSFELLYKLVREIILSIVTTPVIFTLIVYPILRFLKNDFITKLFETKISLTDKISSEYEKRFSNMQALIGLNELKTLDARISERIKNALILREQLKNLKSVRIQKYPKNLKHVYLDFAVSVKSREKIISKLLRFGIDTQRSWLDDCSSLVYFKKDRIQTPVSNKLARSVIYLPIDTQYNKKTVLEIAKHLSLP